MSFIEGLAAKVIAVFLGAYMGRAIVIVRKSSTCDLVLTQRDMGGYRQWAMAVELSPRRLEFRNCIQRQYRVEVAVTRLSIHGRDTRHREGAWIPIEFKYHTLNRLTSWLEPIPDTWEEPRLSMWEVVVEVVMADQRKTVYKGRPTTVLIEREP